MDCESLLRTLTIILILGGPEIFKKETLCLLEGEHHYATYQKSLASLSLWYAVLRTLGLWQKWEDFLKFKNTIWRQENQWMEMKSYIAKKCEQSFVILRPARASQGTSG